MVRLVSDIQRRRMGCSQGRSVGDGGGVVARYVNLPILVVAIAVASS